jgi:hypothetical protein
LRRIEYGDEGDRQMRAFLERIATMNHVADLEKPIFISVRGEILQRAGRECRTLGDSAR